MKETILYLKIYYTGYWDVFICVGEDMPGAGIPLEKSRFPYAFGVRNGTQDYTLRDYTGDQIGRDKVVTKEQLIFKFREMLDNACLGKYTVVEETFNMNT